MSWHWIFLVSEVNLNKEIEFIYISKSWKTQENISEVTVNHSNLIFQVVKYELDITKTKKKNVGMSLVL